MKKFLKVAAGVLVGLIVIVGIGAAYAYQQRDALLKFAVSNAAQMISQNLGTTVEIGEVIIGDINTKRDQQSDISITDLAIYDHQHQLIARADRADVDFKLLALYDDPASAVEHITLTGAEGLIVKRDDGTWNFDDIKTSGGGKTDFNADIKLVDGKLRAEGLDESLGALDAQNINADLQFAGLDDITANGTVAQLTTAYNDNPIDLKTVNANVKFNGASNLKCHVKADNVGEELIVDAAILGGRKTFYINANRADIRDYLPFIPEDTLPESIEIIDGTLSNFNISVAMQGDETKFNGRSNVSNGSVLVEQTVIEHINGTTTFNNKEILVDASLSANNQFADVSGSIRIDGETPYFDIHAAADNFQPSAVLAAIPVDSVASFTAQVTGTVERPLVEADIEVPSIAYNTLYASNIATHFKYFDNAVYLSDFVANTFGGSLRGDIEFQASNYAFNAHVKTYAVDVNRIADYIPDLAGISGRITADLGINGIGDDLDQLKVYGSATATDIYFKDIPIDRIDTSFFARTEEFRIDYLSASMPNRGSIGVEGTINIGREIDLNFYGGHVDLAFINNFLPPSLANINIARLEQKSDSIMPVAYAQPLPGVISGLSDFKGKISGSIENPAVELQFSAIDNSQREGDHFKGQLLNQPFDSIKFSAKGSLQQVSVDDFALTKDGKDHWLAKGTVGLTGAQTIDLQVDTEGARAEDIINLISPDQPLTGNVDNIIKVTGTLEKPEVVGYIHFWRGSYRGMLVNSMDGDYYVEGNTIRVQDFHINTPMIDMDLNGTIDKVTTDMDFTVIMHDIDMRRLQSVVPEDYTLDGHGHFEGIISGSLNGTPIFDGDLFADTLNFNGVEVRNVRGDVGLNGDTILLNNLSFNEGAGSYNVHGAINYVSNTLNGSSVVKNADVKNLLAMSNVKTDVISGNLDSNIRFGGSMYNPSLNIVGTIAEGTVGGSPVRDIVIDVNLINQVAYINKLEGYQGESGYLTASGSGALLGPLNIKITAEELSLDMFAKAAGLESTVAGTAAFAATIEGTTLNPTAHGLVHINGGFKDASFDFMRGEFDLVDGIVDVKNFIVQRAVDNKIYQASAQGKVPLVSLTAQGDPSKLNDRDQLDLTVTLDDANISLLPVLSDYVAWAMGEMQGSLRITGTAAHPLVNGKISVLEGSTKFKAVKSPIEHMNMTLDFTGTKMTIERFDGMVGSGKYVMTGGIEFDGIEPKDYDFKLVADKLEIKSEFYRGPLSFEFELNEDQFYHLGRFPKISGHVDFEKCTMSLPTIPDSEGELPMLLLDTTINFGNKVHFYYSSGAYAYDMYLDGSAHFGGTARRPQPSGEIKVKPGGTVNYFKTIFKISEGEAAFNQLDSFSPSLKFKAEAKLTQARVFLNVEGPVGAANFTMTSSPEMTQEEIIQLLTFRDAYQKGGDNEFDAGDLLTLGLQLSILSEIEGAVRKTLGFDQFTISRGSGSAFDHHGEEHNKYEEEYNVQLGKYITDNVMLKYTRGIGGDNINRYGFQYDFNNNVGLTVERENHDFIFGVEARWK